MWLEKTSHSDGKPQEQAPVARSGLPAKWPVKLGKYADSLLLIVSMLSERFHPATPPNPAQDLFSDYFWCHDGSHGRSIVWVKIIKYSTGPDYAVTGFVQHDSNVSVPSHGKFVGHIEQFDA